MRHRINILLFTIFICLEVLIISDRQQLIVALTITGAVFLLIIGLGVLFLKLSYFVPSTNRLKGDKVLLSFDDGPDPIITRKIGEILMKHNIGALFFLIGNKVEPNKDIAEEIVRNGHLIGNHSYAHNNFMAFFSTKALVNDISKAEKVLNDLSPNRPKIFRPPIGYTTPNYTRALKQLELKCIGWRLRSYDTFIKDSNKLLKRLLRNTRKGDIILFHDNQDVTLEVLEQYITQAKENGIIFVSPEEIKTLFHV